MTDFYFPKLKLTTAAFKLKPCTLWTVQGNQRKLCFLNFWCCHFIFIQWYGSIFSHYGNLLITLRSYITSIHSSFASRVIIAVTSFGFISMCITLVLFFNYSNPSISSFCGCLRFCTTDILEILQFFWNLSVDVIEINLTGSCFSSMSLCL